MKEKLIEKIRNLEELLLENNNPCANYYHNLIIKLQSSDDAILKEVCEEVLPSRTIVQYGDFSYKQEQGWLEMWKIVDEILEDLKI